MSGIKKQIGRFPNLNLAKIPSGLGSPDRSQSSSLHRKDIVEGPYTPLGSEQEEDAKNALNANSSNRSKKRSSGSPERKRTSTPPRRAESPFSRAVSMAEVEGEIILSPHRSGNHTPEGPSMPSPSGGYAGVPEMHRNGSFYDSETRSDCSTSSGRWLRKFIDIPLRVRGRAEAWEVPREQIQMCDELGRGTGGVVFRAKWRGLMCAAKVLSCESQVSVEYHDMINEITVISHLRHPNLVLFLGACTVNEPLLILSEYMAGGSLEDRYNAMRKRLGRPYKPPRDQYLKWMLDLTRAVCFLHNCTFPIMHRDLKPSNLLLSEHDHLKVSDFGLCKTLQKVREDGSPYNMTGCTGTKRYMAPEVVLSKPDYDLKVDIYSMAMIFWYMAKGERPFEQVEPQLISVLASTRGLRPDSKAIHWAPVESLVETMWEEDPVKRPNCPEILMLLKALDAKSDSPNKGELDCNLRCRCNVM